ncbi:protein tyrosine phosphatase family protein [Ketobacter sp.]|uniref:protein tyrosine phosphatase family protein n=1 Tax=Ketobacter sp. TaxID=2083498 RepID=UPI0025BD006E|nr:protein tyrosine phosphatase family protein [Ketobacter sp.]
MSGYLKWSKWKEFAQLFDVRYFNSASSIKTSLGFIKTFLGITQAEADIQQGGLGSIFNYHPIADGLATAGQPQPAHFPLLREAGFTTVINLAPHGAENALANEAELVAANGMQYVHIPVAFDNPTEADFEQFCQALSVYPQQPVFIHCAANMRVSAFVFRYRTQVLGEDVHKAKPDLDKLWKPFGVWADFIGPR